MTPGRAERCRAPLSGLRGIGSTGERPLARSRPSGGPQVPPDIKFILCLRLIPDFVTEEEETELLETFHWEENDGRMKHRQVRTRLTDVLASPLALYVVVPHYQSPAHDCLTFAFSLSLMTFWIKNTTHGTYEIFFTRWIVPTSPECSN